MTMTTLFVRSSLLALAAVASTVSIANAGTSYDGRWSLSITTTRGSCDTYNFSVDITNGHVSLPGLVKANGGVIANGRVHVFVAAMDKSGFGSGRLTTAYGSGHWSGRSGENRCSGSWTAQRA
jgi:hypothetical protein